jgi:putative hydrolase of the HAD superfamily
MEGVRIVGVDGDDTLWRCQDFFDQAAREIAGLLAPWASGATVGGALAEQEATNLHLFGYGVKGFTISAIEVALDLSHGEAGSAVVAAVVDVGKRLLQHPVELLAGAEEAIAALDRTRKVVLVTKGDLVDQQRKLASSGLRRHLAHVEIVSEKDVTTYEELLRTLDCAPGEFLMVGNSERSDVEPVLAVGGWAVHVPYRTNWSRELVDAPSLGHPRRVTVASLSEIPALLAGRRAPRPWRAARP